MKKNNQIKTRYLIMISICFISLLSIFLPIKSEASNENLSYNTDKYIYLSDISYIKEQSYASSGNNIHLDENNNSGIITLKINDKSTPFIKGICAWSTSNLVYDLRDYDYDYFTAYLGVDISEQSNYFNTGAKFYIYLSNDGENWGDPVFKTDTMYGWSEAKFAKIDIKNADYIKLVADDNSDNWWSNWYDETVYADAKLIKEDYEQDNTTVDFIKTVEEYDQIIKAQEIQEIEGDYELTLLQRDFVNKVGYDVLQAFVKYSDESKETVYWLMNDIESLRLYIVGGRPDGSYSNSLKVLTKLYTNYKDDLTNETVTKNGVVLKDLYRKMMISLSLTHSTTVGLWTGPKTDVNSSDAVNRYSIYKTMHEKGLLYDNIFETLTIEEMRWVMNNIIDDEEIEWLNNYSTKKNSLNPYSYIRYTGGYNYSKSEYYDEANYDKWNEKYGLSEYNVSYKTGYPKLWIVFEEGSVCGGLSKTGSNLWGSHGVPSSVVSQPGHAAYIYYSQNANGDGVWNLYNDVYGWAQSGRTEVLSIRMPNDWGSGSYASYTDYIKPDTYILLAQAAQNEYDKYEEAEEILLLADIYKNDTEKLYEIYRKALDAESINFDAWYGLANLYVSDTTKTEQEYYSLTEEISKTLTYYPLPMYDLTRIIEPKFTSAEYKTKFTMLQEKTLKTASKATSNESIQANEVKAVANALLGGVNTNVATFSFDGENAGSIVLSSRYDDVGVRWEYSLDDEETWKETEEHIQPLTEEELSILSAEHDIKIHIVGTSYDVENIFTIDIKSQSMVAGLYNNDLENKIIGATNEMEWKLSAENTWTSYAEKEPDLTGDKTVFVRKKATGTYLPSDTLTYNFTEDNQQETMKYISISHLSIDSFSTETTDKRKEYAINAIDGNINTMWHTDHSIKDEQKYIVIKLDEPKYVSALQYVRQPSYDWGIMKSGVVSVSLDGENWEEAGTINDCEKDDTAKTIIFDQSINAQYVKLQITSHDDYFASAAMINLFEDVTKIVDPEPIDPEPDNPDPVDPEPDNPEPDNPEPDNPEPDNPEPDNPEPDNPEPDNPEPDNPEPDDEKFISRVYNIESGYISKIEPKTKISDFMKNIETNQKVVITDKNGNELSEDVKIATGMIVKVNDTSEYTMIVIGDLDEDGDISINDLAKIKLHIIEHTLLSGNTLKAAEIDSDNKITINDLAKLKLMLIENK